MILDECALALGVDESESVDTEALHVSERSGDSSVRKDPLLHVGGLGVERHKVPGVVVGSLSLGDLPVWLGLDGVNEIDELDGVLNEEDGHVVSDNIPVALIRIEPSGEATRVSHLEQSARRCWEQHDGLTLSADPLDPLTVENLT